MYRQTVKWVLAVLLVVPAFTISADSQPVIEGFASGIELCPQSICGAAHFAGRFDGAVQGRPASGFFSAAIHHDPLPALGQAADITGGQWTIQARQRPFSGHVSGGTLINLDDVQFLVTITMVLSRGGSGEVTFSGILDHGPFPPTIVGFITQ